MVIKSTKSQFGAAELFINQKLTLCGQSRCMARFHGHYYEDGALCLVHQMEGTLTLANALQKSDFPWNVEEALTGRPRQPELRNGLGEPSLARRSMLIRRITSQLFHDLAGIHEWNVVHRDVKGANLILSEKERRFKLIDFGAACDLVSKTNYDPKLQVFDPCYAPPEAPPDEGGLVLSAGGRFDVFSAGLLLVQMCFPACKGNDGIKRFQRALRLNDYSLSKWRRSVEHIPAYATGFRILDRHGGFSLLEGCLQQRPHSRISSAAAARSRFCFV